MKYLIITTPRSFYSEHITEKIKDHGIKVFHSIKGSHKNILVRIIRKFLFKYNFPIRNFLFDKWKYENFDDFDYIIIFRDPYGEFIANYIAQRTLKPIFLFFMDPYDSSIFLDKKKLNERVKIVSFEKKSILKYGFLYNSLFYFESDVIDKKEYLYDVCFIGSDKGRLERLLDIKKNMELLNLKVFYKVMKSPNGLHSDSKKYKYSPRISYTDFLKIISKAKVLLEILPNDQSDMTLRTYEALFYNKKLITNNKNIINEKFYTKENIFVLGVDNWDDLVSFVSSEYKQLTQYDVKQFEFINWLERFKTM